jgi:arsenate reductase
MKIYHNPRCSKSRETLAIIQDKGIKVEVIEYLTEAPTIKELKKLIKLLGKKPFDIIRKGEADFKTHFKGKELSDEEWIDAMIAYPKLIERPIVVSGNKAVLGRPPQNVNALFS